MDLETIKKIVAEKGYAFLTTEQKAVYNAPVVSTKAVETSELGFGSSSTGVDLLKQKEVTATKITTPPVVPSTVVDTTKETKETKEPLPDNTVTLVGPNGEKITFQDWTNNKENIQGWIDKGYQFMEGSNAPVEFATGGGETPQTSSEQIQLDKDKAEYASTVLQLKNFSSNLANDPALVNMLTGISGQWDVRIKEQEQINKSRNAAMTTAGFRLGSRYAGGSIGPTAGIISAEERAGMDKIASLIAQKDQSLLEAKSAYETKKWTQYSKLVDIAEKAYSDSRKAVSDLNKITIEENKKRKEEVTKANNLMAIATLIKNGMSNPVEILTSLNKLGYSIDSATLKDAMDALNIENPEVKTMGELVKTAIENNAPVGVIENMQKGMTIAEVVKAGQGYLEKGSGDLGEALAIQRDMMNRGLIPPSIDNLLVQVANQKAKVQQAINQAGLDKEQRGRVLSLLDDYDQQTKDTRVVLDQSIKIDFLGKSSLSTNTDAGTRAASQIGLIFSYMKMLDPSSTVREGEYATAQNTVGVPDKIRNIYNKTIDGSFLTDGQVNGYVKTAQGIAEASQRRQKTIIEEFDRRGALFGIPIGTIAGSITPESTKEEIIKNETEIELSVTKYGLENPQARESIQKMIRDGKSFSEIKQLLNI